MANKSPQVTGLNVFIEMDGETQTIALIGAEYTQTFLQMVRVFQTGQPEATRLTLLPPEVVDQLLATRQALKEHIERVQKEKQV